MSDALDLFTRIGAGVTADSASKDADRVLVSRELLEKVLAQMSFNLVHRSQLTEEIRRELASAVQQGRSAS